MTILQKYWLGLEKTVTDLEKDNKGLRKKRGMQCRCQANCQAHAGPGGAEGEEHGGQGQ